MSRSPTFEFKHDRPFFAVKHLELDAWGVILDGQRIGPEVPREVALHVVAWLDASWAGLSEILSSHLHGS